MEIDLEGKRALVTGGNRGIGKAICLAFGAAGAPVAVDYVTGAAAAHEIADRIRHEGGDALAIEADVADLGQVNEMFQRIDGEWGGLDILVNNAGIQGSRASSWEIEPQDWRRIVDVNLMGTFLCCRQALERIIPRNTGVILNITSVHERIPWSGFSAYAASKAAISMLTKTLSQEAAPHGVRVLALAPGAIKTPINKQVWQDQERSQELLTKIPLNRIGETGDVARVALFLASEAAGYITGTTLFVDGGMTDYPDFAHGG